MKTKSERFVEEKKERWRELLSILNTISRKGMKKLTVGETEVFPRLYRQTCSDLAEARMLKLSPDVLDYLNNLTGQAHHYLYFMKPLSGRDLLVFFRRDLPDTLLKNGKYVLAALIMFWVSAAGSFFASLSSPDFPAKFMSGSMLEYMEDMYREPVGTGRSGGERAGMAAFYIQHNTSIAFLCFATGIFLGLGSIYFLIYNGIFLGTVIGYLTSAGLGSHIGEFITAHSFLELNAIAIAGAAGMKLGFSILGAWRNYSGEPLRDSKNDILTLVAAAAVMLFFAALTESMISPSTLAWRWKGAIALVSAIAVLFYFIFLPLRQKRSRR